MQRILTMTAAAIVSTVVLGACAGTGSGASSGPPSPVVSPTPGSVVGTPSATDQPVSVEPPVPAESNPPGDIPDTIAFVPYRSGPGSFTISTPEGWARTNTATAVRFTDKLNTVQVNWQSASKAPTVSSAKANELPMLAGSTRAFQVGSVTTVSLPAGPAVLITYQANSEPSAVTGKQYRQDVQRYELFHNGKEIVVALLSPVGADNVDPWRIVTESLKWN